MITRIDLWIQEGQSSPIQEKVTQPSKDYVLISYSDLKVNPDLPDSAFDLKLPEGVKRVKP
jgi:outer membrane lipoprotein-sorting protein